METSINQRLNKLIETKKLSVNALSKLIDMPQVTVNNYFRGDRKISFELIERIAKKFPEINQQWLLTGEGSMLNGVDNNLFPSNAIPSVDVSEFEYIGENKSDGIFFIDQNGVMRLSVPHVPFAARAEFANLSDELEPHLEGWSREMYVVDKKVRGRYLSFDVLGDSMDDGTRDCLQSGDKILARELERDFWKSIRTNDHRYWVIVFGASVLVKEIVDENLDEGTITCHSLNKSPEYHDFVLHLDEVRQLYYVVRVKPRERGV